MKAKEQLNSRSRAAESVRITITTTAQVHRYLTALVPLGLHGNSVAEVAERLICEGLRESLKKSKTSLLEKQTEQS